MRSEVTDDSGCSLDSGCKDPTAEDTWERPVSEDAVSQSWERSRPVRAAQQTVGGTAWKAPCKVTLAAVEGSMLPVCEHAPRHLERHRRYDVRQGDYNRRRGLIRARPLGESIELLSEEDSQPEEGRIGGKTKRRSCSHGLARTWAHLVAAAGQSIQRHQGVDPEVNTMLPDRAPAVTFGEGLRKLLSIMFWDIIHPDSRFQTIWGGLIVVLLIYVALVTTYLLCFEFDNDYTLDFFEIIDLVINAAFMADILFNFRTALRKGDDAASRNLVISDRRFIAYRYLSGWFVIDLLAALPWGTMTVRLGSYMQLAKLLRLMRLLRLLKLSDAMQGNRMYQNVEQRQGVAMARLAIYMVGAILVLHLSASAWFFTAFLESDTLAGTWAEAAGLEDASNVNRYLTSLYFVVITFTTVGYGDVYPVTTAERVMACIGMLIGVVTLGYIISTANSIMGSANRYEGSKAEVRCRVEEFLNAQPLPGALATKVKNYYDFVTQKQFNFEGDNALIESLPANLRCDVLRDVHARLIRQVPFFSQACEQNEELVLRLAAALKLEFYGKGDCVVMEGDWDTELYFVTEGRLAVRQYLVYTRSTFARCTAQPSQTHGRLVSFMGRGAASESRAAGPQSPYSAAASAWNDDGNLGDSAARRTNDTRGSLNSPQHSERDTSLASREAGGPDEKPHEEIQGAAATASEDAPLRPANLPPGKGWGPLSPFAGVVAQATSAAAMASQPAETQPPPSPLRPGRRLWRMHYDAQVPHKLVRLLKPGDYFGEYASLTRCPRTASVVTTRMSELYALKRSDLAAAMSQWPGLLAVWQDCEAYGKAERGRQRQYVRGGRAPAAMSLGLGTDLSDEADEPDKSSQARYKHFLDHFTGDSDKPSAEESRPAVAHPPSTNADAIAA